MRRMFPETAVATLAALAVAVAIAIPQEARAGFWPDVKPFEIGSISVTLQDDADEGCWTNLDQVRSYAEGELEASGYDVRSEGGLYSFAVSVNAFRSDTGHCVGSWSIQVYRAAEVEGVFGYHEIGFDSSVGIHARDFNIWVMRKVDDMITEMTGR